MAIEDIVINATAQQIEDMATRQISQEITEDSSAEELASAKAVYDAVQNAGTGGGTGGSLEPLLVTFDPDTGNATSTPAEIFDYIQNGGTVYFDDAGSYISLSYSDSANAQFIHEANGQIRKYVVLQDGSWYWQDTNFTTKDELGDLDAALAEILNYAQSLTGGGES